ncbi:SET domain-containing protein-lysine N-methyltransferase [Rhizobium binae]|uniref:SET domain-containing protein-lysine N-methyltransferase n=1 Tax=Rhizobium binae TaxID=1138190 RepID=UPI001C83EE7A|nr:SET domain-containing protein [Rhizobium binae]MBX4967862.1 SET domain-containing protein [Rhizobium binae]
MLYFRTKVLHSRIEGRGLFAQETIPCGSVVGNLIHGRRCISEAGYSEAQRNGDERVIHTGLRYAGSLFVYSLPRHGKFRTENEHFINHSEDASLLYHCGTLFALRTISPGEEMTVNYKYFLAEGDITSFRDAKTGRPVQGLDGYRAMQTSMLELAVLLSSEGFSKSFEISSGVGDTGATDWHNAGGNRYSDGSGTRH